MRQGKYDLWTLYQMVSQSMSELLFDHESTIKHSSDLYVAKGRRLLVKKHNFVMFWRCFFKYTLHGNCPTVELNSVNVSWSYPAETKPFLSFDDRYSFSFFSITSRHSRANQKRFLKMIIDDLIVELEFVLCPHWAESRRQVKTTQ